MISNKFLKIFKFFYLRRLNKLAFSDGLKYDITDFMFVPINENKDITTYSWFLKGDFKTMYHKKYDGSVGKNKIMLFYEDYSLDDELFDVVMKWFINNSDINIRLNTDTPLLLFTDYDKIEGYADNECSEITKIITNGTYDTVDNKSLNVFMISKKEPVQKIESVDMSFTLSLGCTISPKNKELGESDEFVDEQYEIENMIYEYFEDIYDPYYVQLECGMIEV